MICFVINIKNNFLEVDRKNKSIEIKKFKRFFSPDRLSKVNLKSKDLDSGEGDEEDPETIKEKKRLAEIERLRAAEKFMEIDEGKFECQACGYTYEPEKGDRFAGINAGTGFQELPESFSCPACRSPKNQFKPIKKVIAGFAENQNYGLGGNSLTGGQKNLLIFGALGGFFLLLLSGYFLE